MNIVMQLRKVCNHPELFERRGVVSPLFFEAPRWGPYPSRVVPVPSLIYNAESPIVYSIPKLLYREGGYIYMCVMIEA